MRNHPNIQEYHSQAPFQECPLAIHSDMVNKLNLKTSIKELL